MRKVALITGLVAACSGHIDPGDGTGGAGGSPRLRAVVNLPESGDMAPVHDLYYDTHRQEHCMPVDTETGRRCLPIRDSTLSKAFFYADAKCTERIGYSVSLCEPSYFVERYPGCPSYYSVFRLGEPYDGPVWKVINNECRPSESHWNMWRWPETQPEITGEFARVEQVVQ